MDSSHSSHIIKCALQVFKHANTENAVPLSVAVLPICHFLCQFCVFSNLRLEALLIFLCRDALQGNPRHFVCFPVITIASASLDAISKLLPCRHMCMLLLLIWWSKLCCICFFSSVHVISDFFVWLWLFKGYLWILFWVRMLLTSCFAERRIQTGPNNIIRRLLCYEKLKKLVPHLRFKVCFV